MERNDPAYKGQAGYNPVLLAIYDPWVLGFMSRAVWHVPIPSFVESYRANIGRRHLDVGPGTGYFIEKAVPPEDTEITLLDPNPHVLRRAGKRLAARNPAVVEADVMKPLPVAGPFDSAALSFVLHCLRGPDANKAIAIRNIADVLTPDGVLFGGTVLGLEERHSKPVRAFLRAANKEGGFDNAGDTAEGLRTILSESFHVGDLQELEPPSSIWPLPVRPRSAGCSTSATRRLAMNRAVRTGVPPRVTSTTSTMVRPVVISTRRPARVAAIS